MSQYNTKQTSSRTEHIPGSSLQQMWHVMKFHEGRLTKIAEQLKLLTNTGTNKTDAQHLVQYNVLLEEIERLKERVQILEAGGSKIVSLAISEEQ